MTLEAKGAVSQPDINVVSSLFDIRFPVQRVGVYLHHIELGLRLDKKDLEYLTADSRGLSQLVRGTYAKFLEKDAFLYGTGTQFPHMDIKDHLIELTALRVAGKAEKHETYLHSIDGVLFQTLVDLGRLEKELASVGNVNVLRRFLHETYATYPIILAQEERAFELREIIF